MSVITQISRIFSKKKADEVLAVSLRQQSIGYCFLPNTASLQSQESSGQNNGTVESSFGVEELKNNTYGQVLQRSKDGQSWRGQCHIVLPAPFSQIVQVDRPSVPDNEIVGALKWQIKDLVSFQPDNMVLDYFDLPVENVGQDKINVVCSPLNELKTIVGVLNQEELEVASITTEEFAFSALVEPKANASLLVCRQPGEEVVILIVKNGQMYFHRRLRGFTQLAEKSPQELDMGAIDSLSLEIQRSTDYFERQLKQAPIKEVLVLVPMENEAYLARRLAENTNVPVELLKLAPQFEQQREQACAIGAIKLAQQSSQEVKHES